MSSSKDSCTALFNALRAPEAAAHIINENINTLLDRYSAEEVQLRVATATPYLYRALDLFTNALLQARKLSKCDFQCASAVYESLTGSYLAAVQNIVSATLVFGDNSLSEALIEIVGSLESPLSEGGSLGEYFNVILSAAKTTCKHHDCDHRKRC